MNTYTYTFTLNDIATDVEVSGFDPIDELIKAMASANDFFKDEIAEDKNREQAFDLYSKSWIEKSKFNFIWD